MNIDRLGQAMLWATGQDSGNRTATASAPAGSDAAKPQPSATVTLSEGAKTLARFAEKGLAMTAHRLDRPLGPGAGSPASGGPAQAFVPVGQERLEALLTELGASADEARSLAQGLDRDGDAALSREELLQGIARAGKDPADPNAQTLLRLADGLGRADGVVSQQELGTLSGRLLAQGRG